MAKGKAQEISREATRDGRVFENCTKQHQTPRPVAKSRPSRRAKSEKPILHQNKAFIPTPWPQAAKIPRCAASTSTRCEAARQGGAAPFETPASSGMGPSASENWKQPPKSTRIGDRVQGFPQGRMMPCNWYSSPRTTCTKSATSPFQSTNARHPRTATDVLTAPVPVQLKPKTKPTRLPRRPRVKERIPIAIDPWALVVHGAPGEEERDAGRATPPRVAYETRSANIVLRSRTKEEPRRRFAWASRGPDVRRAKMRKSFHREDNRLTAKQLRLGVGSGRKDDEDANGAKEEE
ncbi:hypothetical protein B0H16DRAFT_1475598 [Mycena metata]|uniref:Uncharacterized protein n=1 Tax=Mycena metata TaxID=1033252 RepID=A0AAD7HE35_9AGAR|nr:hypothetical protein B0H16DRAFT_1475598 [Mycena metata]